MLLIFFTGPAAAASQSTDVTARVTLSPLEVLVSVPFIAEVDTEFQVKAITQNLGSDRVTKAAATLILPGNWELVSGKAEDNLGTILPHDSKTSSWRVRALKTGNYSLIISVSGKYDQFTVTGKKTVPVTIVQNWISWWFDFCQRYSSIVLPIE